MDSSPKQLPIYVKLLYGSGDWGISCFNTLRLIFYAIFLTDVVGLDPRLASFTALIGLVWDAINDPLVGAWSDRLHNGRFGKRRTFLVYGTIPFAFGFMLLWWAPPITSPFLLFAIVTLSFMLADTMQSVISVPYYSLTPALTADYNERTSLTSYRMLFNIISSLVVAIVAPSIVDGAIASGASAQQGYVTVSAIFGASAAVPLLLIGFFIREDPTIIETQAKSPPLPLPELLKIAWSNIPLRFATAIYMLNWMTFDLIALMFPFFLTYWVADGDLLGKTSLFGLSLPHESAVLGVLLITAAITLPLWNAISKKYGKRHAYISSVIFWAVAQLCVLFIGQNQINTTIFIAFLIGISASAAHVLPEAIFPDVMEWDELRLGRRYEGVYYGIKNFSRKLTGALATFIALQLIGWFGYQAPAIGATAAQQPDSALFAIRLLTGPLGSGLLIIAAFVTYFYPLTRAKHARIRLLLQKRQAKQVLKPS